MRVKCNTSLAWCKIRNASPPPRSFAGFVIYALHSVHFQCSSVSESTGRPVDPSFTSALCEALLFEATLKAKRMWRIDFELPNYTLPPLPLSLPPLLEQHLHLRVNPQYSAAAIVFDRKLCLSPLSAIRHRGIRGLVILVDVCSLLE